MNTTVSTKQLDDALAKQTNDITEIMQSFMQQVGDPFIEVNRRLDLQDEKSNVALPS